MRGPGRSRRLASIPSLLLLVSAGALLVAATGGCGGGDDDGKPPSSSTPPSSVTARPDFTAPSASPSPASVTQVDVKSELAVVRGKQGDRAVWLVTPATGAAERVAELPFEPGAAAASPDHRFVAYLKGCFPRPGWRRTLTIVDLDGGVIWPDLQGTGLRSVGDMTWLSPTELLVSGPVPKGNGSPEDDRLYSYDTATGEWSPFHVLDGADPSASPAAGSVAFRRLATLEQTGSGPRVREDLLLFDSVTAAASTILSSDYVIYAAGNLYEQPALSPGGRYVLAAQTGSDTGVTWSLYRVDDGKRLWERVQSMAHPLVGAWDEDGRRLAFWGVPATGRPKTTVWVYDVQTGRFAVPPTKGTERVVEGMVTGLDWSRHGDLAASTSEGATDTVFIAPDGDPAAFVALCTGSLPVWLR